MVYNIAAGQKCFLTGSFGFFSHSLTIRSLHKDLRTAAL